MSSVKEQYGSDPEEDGDETDSESLESEDSDGEELTPAMDAAILRTLARIKRKDPEIYQDGKDIFGGTREMPFTRFEYSILFQRSKKRQYSLRRLLLRDPRDQ